MSNSLADRAKQLQKWIKEKEEALASAPKGKLHGKRVGDKYQYFCRFDKKDTNGTYIKVKNISLAHALGQKRYDELVFRASITELAKIRRILRFYGESGITLPSGATPLTRSGTTSLTQSSGTTPLTQSSGTTSLTRPSGAASTILPSSAASAPSSFQPLNLVPEQIYEKLPDWLQTVVTPIVEPIGPKVKKWLAQEYEGRPFAEDDTSQFYTPSGVRVRSKSEMTISQELSLFGIPYLYELPLRLANGKLVYPDFSTVDMRTGRLVYWEHLGLLDKDDYRDMLMYKSNALAEMGIFVGINLIITYETGKYALNSKIVRERIWQFYGR